MFILSNLAISLDGKIAFADRKHAPIGTPYDRKQMQVIRKQCDAILMGASTVRAFQKPCLIQNSKKQPYNILLSTNLKGLSTTWEFFKHPIKKIIFYTGTVSKTKVAAFEKYAELIKINPHLSIALQIVQALKKRRIKRLLVEGGGGVMWHFVEKNLIDEYHVTLTPKIIGGAQTPTLVDGLGFKAPHLLLLKPKKIRRVGNELYLTYKKVQIV